MLTEKIAKDLTAAMKAQEKTKMATLRMLQAAIKMVMVEKRTDKLSDDEALSVITKEAKKRRESITAFADAGRKELAEKEAAELEVLEAYLPEAMDDAELEAIVDEVIAEVGATDAKQMGLVMKGLMPKLQGRADGGKVSALVKAKLIS